MVLATVKVEDFDRFLETFTTKGAEKRKQYGSKGSRVFRDPNDETRAWVLFDWDEDGYQKLMSDPEMPGIFEEGGPPRQAPESRAGPGTRRLGTTRDRGPARACDHV